MRMHRRLLHTFIGRAVTFFVIAATFHLSAGPGNFLYALEVERQKEQRIRDIAAKLDVDPEFLLNPQGRRQFDFRSLFTWASQKLGLSGNAVAESQQPLDIREAIAKTKSRYALVAADSTLSKIARLVELSLTPENLRGKRKGQIRAELQSIFRLADKDFLPAVDERLPDVAQSRDRETRRAVKDLQQSVKQVLNRPGALEEENVESTLAQLRQVVAGTLVLTRGKTRWTRDPFPLKDTYRKAQTREVGQDPGNTSSNPSVIATAAAPTRVVAASTAIAPEVAALAAQLGTPAKIFAYVHDRIEWESYSGVAKGSLGTLREGRGNDWDQALLLRDMLQALGYNALLEWGTVSLPIARAMNLVGTEDPTQAGNLLATAGFKGLALTNNGSPVAIQMTHAWVRSFIPYIPNRGATPGVADTWVRMDPSFKRYEYQPGIKINGFVPWNEESYINAATLRQPSDHYGDQIWSYIRAKNLNCENLSQVAKLGRVKAENFPYVPSTLTARIDQVAGAAAAPPADQVQNVSIAVTNADGGTVVAHDTAIADLWGRKLTLTFPPATADDAAIIASYGGLFNTPAYLIRLKPTFAIDDAVVAQGAPVPAGAALEINLTFRQPNVADDFARHDAVAGETHTLVFDAGMLPDSLVAQRIERLKALVNANAPEDQILSEKLFLVGARYMQHVDDGLHFAAGVRWQRAVKRVFEADVRRQLDVTYNIAGAPLRLKPAENNIDVARLVVGVIPIDNDLTHRAEALALAGLQSSYLEGAIWEEMQSQEGISAAEVLVRAKASGQQIHTVTASNVDAILAQTNLPAEDEAEIRGAVQQGRIARIPSANITLNRWSGTGYILRDPQTGAATFPISGGMAGGSTTGANTEILKEMLGSEVWLGGTALGAIGEKLVALLGGSQSEKPSTTQADPVNMSSGNMFREVTDLVIPARGITVGVARTYNSRSTYNGLFGYGWTFNYGAHLTANPDGSVTYREGDGSEHLFAFNGSTYIPPAGKHLQLTSNGSGWTMRASDGTRMFFDSRGLVVSQNDLNGNTLRINRDSNGNPTTIIDAAGRTVLTFTIASGKITEIADLGGRRTIYGYNGDDLVSVTDTAGKTWTYSYDLSHNMTAASDPLGHTQSYDYDTDDRLFHHVDAIGAEEFFQYDVAGRRGVVTEKRGGDRLVVFDDRGRATLEADPAGNVMRASFDTDNNVRELIDSRGFSSTYEYDQAGNITKKVSPDGGVTFATYDSNSRVLTSTDQLNVTTTNSYDSNGNLLSSSRTVGDQLETSTNTYDSHGQLLTSTDPNGGVTTIGWHPLNGTLASRKDPQNGVITFATDALGRVTSMRDAAQNETKLTYDGRDRITSATDPHGLVTTFEYDDAGRRTKSITPRGTTIHEYDREDRIVAITDPAGNKVTTTFNHAGDVLARTDGRGNTTRYEYDLAGRVTKMIDASGGVWSYGYCAAVGGSSCSTCGGGGATGGTYCELTDPNGNVIRQEFDSMGRVALVTDSLSHAMSTQFDKAGRKILETDANGNATSYGYDEAGRLVSVREANGNVTAFTYDKNGNKLTQQDAKGQVWSFKYDELNRLIEERNPLDRVTTYTYDALGNLKTKTDPKGQVFTFSYDVRRVISIAYPGGLDEYTYDALGRRITAKNANAKYTYSYDALNRVRSVTNETTQFTVSYEYDAAGNRAKLITPASTTTYVYDAKNRLTAMNDTLFKTFRFEYDAMDRRTQLVYPNGATTSYDYDAAYRMTAVVTKDALGAIIDAWSYQYDSVGNRTSKTDMNGVSETYRYDDVYRLTEASYADGTFERFTYDKAGNRATRTTDTGTITYSYDVANQLTSGGGTFTYDLNGNLLTKATPTGNTTVTYDALNRPTQIAAPDGNEVNLYGPLGERVRVSGAAFENGTFLPQYDLSGNPVTDLNTSFGTHTHRLYAPGVDEPLAEWRASNNRITYIHRDALGSVTAVTSSSGLLAYQSRYKAFGEMSRTAYDLPTTRLGFTSREKSVSGLMQYRSRYYDPSQSRFLQQDEYRGSEGMPPSLHRYTYVYNNPILFFDPSGNVTVNPYPGHPRNKSCGVLLASIMWYTWAIEKRMSELKPNSLPLFGENSMFGHCIQITGLQAGLMMHVNEFWKRCQPPQYGPQPDWNRVQAAYAEDPLPIAIGELFIALLPWLLIGGAILLIAAILSAPVSVPVLAAVGVVAILFLGTWVATSYMSNDYNRTSMDLLTNV